MPADRQPVTQLLHAWRQGDASALNQLMPLVYDQLRAIAGRRLQAEAPGHTLGATAVVHEAFIRLAGAEVQWQDRAHFLAISARVMRRILVDHARGRDRERRGGGAARVPLDEIQVEMPGRSSDVEALDEALSRLAALDERKAAILELLYFGGLTYPEIAEVRGVSEATVHRELTLAKAWLRREMGDAG